MNECNPSWLGLLLWASCAVAQERGKAPTSL
jgi:hypothetical protein